MVEYVLEMVLGGFCQTHILMLLPGICLVYLPRLPARRECQGRARRMKPRHHLACSLRFRRQRLHWEFSAAKGSRGLKHARKSSAGRLLARIGYMSQACEKTPQEVSAPQFELASECAHGRLN